MTVLHLERSTDFDLELSTGRSKDATEKRAERLGRKLKRLFGVEVVDTYIQQRESHYVVAQMRIRFPEEMSITRARWLLIGYQEIWRVTLPPRAQL